MSHTSTKPICEIRKKKAFFKGRFPVATDRLRRTGGSKKLQPARIVCHNSTPSPSRSAFHCECAIDITTSSAPRASSVIRAMPQLLPPNRAVFCTNVTPLRSLHSPSLLNSLEHWLASGPCGASKHCTKYNRILPLPLGPPAESGDP